LGHLPSVTPVRPREGGDTQRKSLPAVSPQLGQPGYGHPWGLARPLPLSVGSTLPSSLSQVHEQVYSQGQKTLGALGQCQAGDKADD
jgi:hypothetical protein